MLRKIKKLTPALLIILAVSAWSTWPVIKDLRHNVSHGNEDIYIVWILNQTIQKIPRNLVNIFDSNTFYPHENTLAFSVMLIPSAFLSWIPVKLTGSPVTAYGFTLFTGQVLTILLTYLFVKDMSKNAVAALLAALLFSLSQIRILFNPHLQMWTMQWWIGAVWMVWRYKTTKNVKYIYLFSMFTTIQFWEALLPVYWILFSSIFILWKDILKLFKERVHILANLALLTVVNFPVANTYLQISALHGFSRTIRDAAHFGMSVEFLWENFLSPALYLLLALSTIMILLIKNRKNKFWISVFLVFSFLMSFGPVLKWIGSTVKVYGVPIPMPYGIFYYLIPGFSALRAPIRWIIPTAFAASVFVGLVISGLEKSKRKFFYVIAFTILILGSTRVKESTRLRVGDDIPEVYKVTGLLSRDVIVELPTYTWTAGKLYKNEMYRQYYSLYHNKKTPGGVSGFYPESWLKLRKGLIMSFPSKKAELELKGAGVDYLIVHKDQYDKYRFEKINNWGRAKIVWENEAAVIFSL